MSEKIVSALNLGGMDYLNFTEYLGHIKSHMMAKSHKE